MTKKIDDHHASLLGKDVLVLSAHDFYSGVLISVSPFDERSLPVYDVINTRGEVIHVVGVVVPKIQSLVDRIESLWHLDLDILRDVVTPYIFEPYTFETFFDKMSHDKHQES